MATECTVLYKQGVPVTSRKTGQQITQNRFTFNDFTELKQFLVNEFGDGYQLPVTIEVEVPANCGGIIIVMDRERDLGNFAWPLGA